jgi:hypothetical protein
MIRPTKVGALVWCLVACGGESTSDGPAPLKRPGGTGGAAAPAQGGASGRGRGGATSTGGDSGEGGERASGGATSTGASGGRGGKRASGGMAGDGVCAAGEGGALSGVGAAQPVICGAVVHDVDDRYALCTKLDCVSDCTSSAVVQGELDECDVLHCPPEAPIPARECAQECGWTGQVCGPGLRCIDPWGPDWPCTESTHCACYPVPESCPPPGDNDWICAADGRTYPSSCEAGRARTRIVDTDGDCPAPRGDLYLCGGIFCLKNLETCRIEWGPDDHDYNTYSCLPAGGAGGESGAGAGGVGAGGA